MDGFFEWLWLTSWQVTILIAVVGVVLLTCRRWLPVGARYALTLLILVRLFLPVVPESSIGLLRIEDRFFPEARDASERLAFELSEVDGELPGITRGLRVGEEAGFNAKGYPQLGHSDRVKQGARTTQGSQNRSQWVGEAGGSPRTKAVGGIERRASSEAGGLGTPTAATAKTDESCHGLFVVRALWLGGFVTILTLTLCRHRRFTAWAKRRRGLTESPYPELLEEAKQALGVRQSVMLLVGGRLSSPVTFGIRRPKILIPEALLGSLTPTEIRGILLHELAHVRRRDALLNWAMIVAQAVYWFHPLVWLGLRQLRLERELLCDQCALKHLGSEGKQAYGEALIKALASAGLRPASTVVPIFNHKQHMKRRVQMISHTKQPSRLTVAVSAVIILTVAGLTFTRAHDRGEQRQSFTSNYDAGHQSLPIPKLKKKVEVLDAQLGIYNKRINHMENRLDEIRSETKIEPEKSGSNAQDIAAIQNKMIQAQNDLVKWRSLYENFQNMEMGELREAIQVSYLEDELIQALQERLHQFEQEKVKLLQEVTPEHPDLKEVESMINTINRQINDRVRGLMKGLKARVSSARSEVKEFKDHLNALRAEDSKSEAKARPYYRLQDRLKNIKRMRDSIHRKLMEAELELAVRRALRNSEDRGDGSGETKTEAE